MILIYESDSERISIVRLIFPEKTIRTFVGNINGCFIPVLPEQVIDLVVSLAVQIL